MKTEELLSEILARIDRQLQLTKLQIPVGVMFGKYNLTDETRILPLNLPLLSLSLINDGPDSVTIWINKEGDPLTDEDTGVIKIDEVFNLDMMYPTIWKINLRAETGGTATVRIYGKQGRTRIT